MRLPIHGMIAGALGALLLLVGSALGASQKDRDDCLKASGDTAIAARTHLINDGSESVHNRAVAYYNRGSEYDGKRDLDRAMADYDQAIRLDPKYAHAYNNRGIAWLGKKDNDRAMADYDQAIRLDPKLSSAYYNRGLVWKAKGDKARAIADFTEAQRLGDTDAADKLKELGQ